MWFFLLYYYKGEKLLVIFTLLNVRLVFMKVYAIDCIEIIES